MTTVGARDASSRGFWIGGELVSTGPVLTVNSPWDGAEAGRYHLPGPDDVERGIALAAASAPVVAALPAYVRADALDQVSRTLAARVEDFARTITAESGKPIRWARLEVMRAVSTFRWAAEEARRFAGELQRLDTEPGGDGRLALVRRVSRGPVLGITPFNFPLNLVAHKAAPAIASGSPIIIKPAPSTPLTALLLGEVLAETDLPPGSWAILPVANADMNSIVEDPRLPVVSFTGSVPVGWSIRERVPRKHVTLELGGNAAVYVAADWRDLRFASDRIAAFGFGSAGQSCISVQRIYAHADIYDALVVEVAAAADRLIEGSPWDATTDVGPLITATAALRVETWVLEARNAGAVVVRGGSRDGASVAPTILADVPGHSAVLRDEVFGPVVAIERVDSDAAALARIDDSRFGLQAGIFTESLTLAFRAASELNVGGVIIGDVPSYRADQMPYGGVKDSGVGREGVRSAMLDFTEDRVLVLNTLGRS